MTTRRDFFKVLAVAGAAVFAPAVMARPARGVLPPAVVRTVSWRIDMQAWQVHYRLDDIVTGTVWEFCEIVCDERSVPQCDRDAAKAFSAVVVGWERFAA